MDCISVAMCKHFFPNVESTAHLNLDEKVACLFLSLLFTHVLAGVCVYMCMYLFFVPWLGQKRIQKHCYASPFFSGPST